MKNNKVIIGVMGPGKTCDDATYKLAQELGFELAKNNYIVLTGGRDHGVMEAALKGAKVAGGTTVGILPNTESSKSQFIDIPIYTNSGLARNYTNVLTAQIIIVVGIGLGTSSEIALAMCEGKKVILLGENEKAYEYFSTFSPQNIFKTSDIGATIDLVNTSVAKL